MWSAGFFAGILWLVFASVTTGVTPSPDRVVYGTSESRSCGTSPLPFGGSIWSNSRGECHNPRPAFSPFAEAAAAIYAAPDFQAGFLADQSQSIYKEVI